MDGAGGAEPDNMRLPGLGVGHLAILRTVVTGDVPYDFADIRDAGCAQRVTFGKEAARYVNRRLAAEVRMLPAALVDKLAGFAVFAEAKVLVVHQLRSREAVMQLGEVDILRSDSSLLIRLLGSAARERAHVGQRQVAIGPWIGGQHRRRDFRALPATSELL